MRCFVLLTCLVFFAGGCDKINPPYKKTQAAVTDTNIYVRNVLVEDYSGHLCVNCPTAAVILEHLADTVYKGRIIPIAVHSGLLPYTNGLTNVIPGNGMLDGCYFGYNFITAEGTAYDTQFGISKNGLPGIMVNRAYYNPLIPGSCWFQGTDPVQWTDSVATFIGTTAKPAPLASVYITISNSFTASSNSLVTTANVEFLQAVTGTYNLCMVYTEDSIIQGQKTLTGVTCNYVFNHILRGSLNTTWGTPVSTALRSTSANTFGPVALDSVIVPKHCNVIAYVYNASTFEVMQAVEKNLLTP